MVHRAGDSGWIEFNVDGRATGAETTRTVACVPGGAWPGRSAVQLAAGKCTRLLQSEGQQPTGGRAVTVRGSEGKTNCTCEVDSQVILFDGRGPSEGRAPRVTARRAMEAYGGASGLLHPQDPGLESGDQGVRSEPSWTELRADSAGFLSRRPDVSCVEDGRFSVFVFRGRTCVTNTFVAGEGGRSVRDWLVSLHLMMSL